MYCVFSSVKNSSIIVGKFLSHPGNLVQKIISSVSGVVNNVGEQI